MSNQNYETLKNAWIDPYGEFYECNFFGHEEWAREYLQDQALFVDDSLYKVGVKQFTYRELQKATNLSYAHEYLCKKGWLRLLTWDVKLGTKVVGYSDTQRPNADQEDSLYLYCSKNKLDYNSLFER